MGQIPQMNCHNTNNGYRYTYAIKGLDNQTWNKQSPTKNQ